MTRSILILLLLLSSFSYAQTYSYKPIPKSDAVWKGRNRLGLFRGGTCEKYQYKLDGIFKTTGTDTFYSIQVLGAEWSSGIDFPSKEPALEQNCISDKVFDFPIETKTTGSTIWMIEKKKRIYILDSAFLDTSIHTAYIDFNLKVGDTAYWPKAFSGNGVDTIVSVDTVNINGALRKRIVRTFFLSWGIGGTDTLIEGIGSLRVGLGFYGLMNVGHNPIPFGEVICFTHNSQQEFVRYNSLCADMWPLGISKEVLNEDRWKISPNPFYDKIQLQHIKGATVYIYNATGRLVYKEQSIKDNTMQISTLNWPTGLFIVTIENRDSKQVQKLIKY